MYGGVGVTWYVFLTGDVVVEAFDVMILLVTLFIFSALYVLCDVCGEPSLHCLVKEEVKHREKIVVKWTVHPLPNMSSQWQHRLSRGGARTVQDW